MASLKDILNNALLEDAASSSDPVCIELPFVVVVNESRRRTCHLIGRIIFVVGVVRNEADVRVVARVPAASGASGRGRRTALLATGRTSTATAADSEFVACRRKYVLDDGVRRVVAAAAVFDVVVFVVVARIDRRVSGNGTKQMKRSPVIAAPAAASAIALKTERSVDAGAEIGTTKRGQAAVETRRRRPAIGQRRSLPAPVRLPVAAAAAAAAAPVSASFAAAAAATRRRRWRHRESTSIVERVDTGYGDVIRLHSAIWRRD